MCLDAFWQKQVLQQAAGGIGSREICCHLWYFQIAVLESLLEYINSIRILTELLHVSYNPQKKFILMLNQKPNKENTSMKDIPMLHENMTKTFKQMGIVF